MLREFLLAKTVGQFSIPGQVLNVIMVLIIFALAYTMYRLIIARIIDSIVRRSGVESGVGTFWKYTILAIVMIIAGAISASLFGEVATAIYFALGLILGAVVLMLAFGLKDVLLNTLSGYALMVYKPFKRGDIVVIDGKPGYVRDITAMYTEIVREDGIYYVPNSRLIKIPFLMKPIDITSKLTITIKVKSGIDIDMAEQLIKDAVKQCKEVITPPEPEVYVTEINSQSLTLQLAIGVANPRRLLQAKSKILKMIKQAFESAGIELS